MLNMLNFSRGLFGQTLPTRTREKIQHIQHFKGFGEGAEIQHFKGFGKSHAPKPLKMLNLSAPRAPQTP